MGYYKAVCFDLFDTIIDFDAETYRSIQTEAIMSIGINPEDFFTHWEATHEKALTGVFQVSSDRFRYVLQLLESGDKARNCLPDLLRMERRAISCSIRVIEGVVQLFQELLKKDKRLAVISNASALGCQILDISGLSTYLDEVIFSFIEKVYKPDPAIFTLAADRLGFRTKQIAFVSDGDRGELSGAARAGMHTFRFDPGKQFQEQYLPPGCYDCVNIQELTDKLMI